MDRLMRFLPVPTGGKPSKWYAFSEKKSLLTSHRSKGCVLVYGFEKKVSSFPTAHELSKWSAFSGVFSLHYPLEGFAGFERKILKFSFLSTYWTEIAVWPKESETFFSQYPLEGNGLFGQKDLKLFLSSTPLDSSGRFERKIFMFSSFSTHWTKIAVWSKKSETFFFHYPTDMRCRSGPLFRKLFSPNTQRTHGAVLNERK